MLCYPLNVTICPWLTFRDLDFGMLAIMPRKDEWLSVGIVYVLSAMLLKVKNLVMFQAECPIKILGSEILMSSTRSHFTHAVEIH